VQSWLWFHCGKARQPEGQISCGAKRSVLQKELLHLGKHFFDVRKAKPSLSRSLISPKDA
jgi:hypothetical protein